VIFSDETHNFVMHHAGQAHNLLPVGSKERPQFAKRKFEDGGTSSLDWSVTARGEFVVLAR
jgi:hypothetical protein